MESFTHKHSHGVKYHVIDSAKSDKKPLVSFSFSNGSVKVRFRVVVKVDKQEEKPAEVFSKVGETLRDNVKNGQIGNLKVKKTLEMEGNVFALFFYSLTSLLSILT